MMMQMIFIWCKMRTPCIKFPKRECIGFSRRNKCKWMRKKIAFRPRSCGSVCKMYQNLRTNNRFINRNKCLLCTPPQQNDQTEMKYQFVHVYMLRLRLNWPFQISKCLWFEMFQPNTRAIHLRTMIMFSTLAASLYPFSHSLFLLWSLSFWSEFSLAVFSIYFIDLCVYVRRARLPFFTSLLYSNVCFETL